MSEAPREVRELAAARAAARAARDFPTADRLRDEITALGWTVSDGQGGTTLAPAVVHRVTDVHALPDRSGVPDRRPATVSLLIEGWVQDALGCLNRVLAETGPEVGVQVVTVGLDEASRALLDEPSTLAADRLEVWHVAQAAGWGEARGAALRADDSAVHIWCEPSTLFEGDAVSPLLELLAAPDVVAAGWRGVNVDVDDSWRSFAPAGPGDVDAVLGYLLAVRRQAALSVGGPDPGARYYRNADMEFCFLLREAGLGRIVAAEALPCSEGRHHGYLDADPEYRDRESRRNYQRFLDRFRGREQLLAPRPPVAGPQA